jgi:hypothetical protein
LSELRQSCKLTQVSIAKTVWVTQDSGSRLEKRSDLLLSTRRKTQAPRCTSLIFLRGLENLLELLLAQSLQLLMPLLRQFCSN